MCWCSCCSGCAFSHDRSRRERQKETFVLHAQSREKYPSEKSFFEQRVVRFALSEKYSCGYRKLAVQLSVISDNIWDEVFDPNKLQNSKSPNQTLEGYFSIVYVFIAAKRKIYKSEDNCCCCKYNQFGIKKSSVDCFTEPQVKSVKIFNKLYKCLQKLSIQIREPSNIRFLDKLRYLKSRK